MKSDAASTPREAEPFLYRLRLIDRPYLLVLIFVVAAVFAYSNTFDVPFQFDDLGNISQNPLVKDVKNIPTILTGSKGPFASRPIMHATFALNYRVGGLDTTGYHAVNLALHLINGILIYLLVTVTGRISRYDSRRARFAGVLSSLLFLLHPVQTEAVTYVVSRSMLFAATFFLLGMVLYAKAVTAEKKKGLYVAGLFVVSLLGMGSRENFATFVIMIIAYDLLFVTGLSLRETLRHYRAYVPVLISLGYLAFIVFNNTYDTATEYQGLGVSRKDYVLTQFSVHWTYLRLLVLPVNQNVDYDYRLSSSLLDVRTLAAAAGYLGMWVFAIASARKRPVAAFSVMWFLVTLLPISFAVAFMDLRLDDVIFEHRLYLPGAGIIVGASAAAAYYIEKLGERKRSLVLSALVLIMVPSLAVATYQRNEVWQSEFSLWRDAAVKSPGKARPHNNLGFAYFTNGFVDRAITHYEDALAADPDYAEAHYNIGLAYSDGGLKQKAMEHYQRAVALRPDMVDAQINLGSIYMDIGKTALAAEHYKAAIKEIPMYYKAHVNLGNAYMAMSRYDGAIEHFSIAVGLRPYEANVYNNLANAYYLSGREDEANRYFKKALELQRMGR